jgi:hypothetical protein
MLCGSKDKKGGGGGTSTKRCRRYQLRERNPAQFHHRIENEIENNERENSRRAKAESAACKASAAFRQRIQEDAAKRYSQPGLWVERVATINQSDEITITTGALPKERQ